MAIQIPDAGTGNGATGDNEFVLWSKVINNFSDQTNAASRLLGTGEEQVPLSKNIPSLLGAAATKDVGTASGNVMEVGAFGIGSKDIGRYYGNMLDMPTGFYYTGSTGIENNHPLEHGKFIINYNFLDGRGFRLLTTPYSNNLYMQSSTIENGAVWNAPVAIYHTGNTTKDSNGMIKASSPVLRVFSTHIEGNEDGEKMGAKFVKNSEGNYLLKGTTGLADEGWYVTVPQDANGNNLVAVEYESLESGDVVLRTYKRKFDFETVRIVADHDNPLDIPETRWIDLRFNEIPVKAQGELLTEGG